MATARVPQSGWNRRPSTSHRRRHIAALALWLLATTVVYAHLTADHDHGLRGPIAHSLNTAIAWSDLNLGLSPRLGAQRAVQLDPTLRTRLGRQGARWLARTGTLSQRLRWAGALAQRDPTERPLLRRAASDAWCSANPKLRVAARVALKHAGLPIPTRRPC
jgi:hypothetical protein